MTAMSTSQSKRLGQEEGELRWWFDGLAAIKLSAADTGRQFSLTEMLYPAGAVVPQHVHHREDELFYVLEGEITIQVCEHSYVGGAGATILAPRDVPHGFTVTSSQPVRYLILYTPAGFEGFIMQSSQPALQATLPPPPQSPPTQEQIEQLTALI